MAGREKSTHIVKKLKQTEERYRELFDSINVCVAVYKVKNDGEDFVIKDFNTAAENVEKVSRRDIIGKSILAIFPNVKEFGIFEVMQRVWKTEVPEHFPAKLYKDNRISGWRDNYVYKLPSGDIVAVYEDVTERIKGEKALNEAEQRYKIVADFTYDWEFWRSPQGKMLYVSPACERITGYTPAQFMKDARLMDRIILPEDKSIRAAHQDRIKDLVSDKAIYRIKRKDGDVRWIEHVCRPILDDNGTFLGTRGSNRDITARKKAEEKLEESEDKYRTILESMDEAYYETDIKGNLTFFNDALTRLLGYTREELLGMNYSKFVPASDRAAVRDLYTQVYRTGGSSELHRQAHKKKDGSTIYVEVSALPIKNANGEVTGFRGVTWDITARIKAEEELEFRAELLDSAKDSIFMLDLAGNFIYANEACYQTRGYTKEEFMSLNIKDIDTPEYAAKADARIAGIVSKEDLVFEVAHQHKDGSIIPVEIHSRTIMHNGKTCLLSVARDITERKRAEEALKKSEEQFRMLAENSADAIWTLDAGLNLTYMSPAIMKILGVTQEEAFQLSIWDSMTPDSLQNLTDTLEYYRRDIEQGTDKIAQLEIEHKHKDGSTVWTELAVRALYDKAGKHTGFIGVTRNISDRKKAEDALRTSEEKYRLLAENADDVIWTLDTDLHVTYISPSVRKLRNVEPEEAMTESVADIMTPASLNRIMDELELKRTDIEKGIDTSAKLEIEFYSKDGSTVPVEMVIRVLYDGDGKHVGFIGISRDITERKRADKLLEQINRRLTDIIEFLPDATLAIDNDNKVILWNHAIEQMTGIAASEMIGKGDYAYTIPFYGEARPFLMDLVSHDSENVRARYPYILRDGDSFISEVFCPALNGGKGAWVFAKASPLHDRDGNIIGVIESIRDITDSKRAEEELRHSEEQYRLLAENAEDVIWTADPEFNFTYISPSVFKLRGLEPQEAMRQTLEESMTPESLQTVLHELEGNRLDIEAGTDRSVRLKLEQYHKDGTTVWVEVVVRPLYDNTGQQTGFYGVSRDITERVKAEEKLSTSEQKYRLLAENAGDTIWTMDSNLVPTYVSPAIRKLRGFEPEEAMRQTIKDQCTPSSFEATQRVMKRAWTDAKSGIIGTYRVIAEQYRKDESTVWVESTIRPFHDDADRFAGFIGVSRDVTERVQAEEKVSTSEEKYRLLAENSEDVIWTVDTSFMYTYVSPSIFKLRGFKPEEIIGQPMISTMTPQSQQILAEQWGANSNAAQEGTKVTWRGEIHAPRKDGSMVWTDVVVRTLHDDNGRHIGFIGVSRDISERKAADEALRESQAKYYELLENAGEAILIAQDGLIKFINSRLTEMTGYSAAEYLNTPFANYIHKDDADMVSAKYAARMKGEEVESSYVFRVIHKDGHILWVEIHAALATWEGRLASLNFLTDITESKKAKDALQESESRYNLLAEHTDDVLWVLDRNLHMTYVSPSIRKLRGVEPEEAMQEDFASILTPQSLQKILHLLKVNLPDIEGGRDGSARIEVEQYRKDRSTVWVELNMNELRDDTGKFIGFTGTARDITARKASEQAIRESEEKFRNIFEQSKDAIFITDKDAKLLDVNDSLCDLVGYSKDEMLNPGPLVQDTSKRFLSIIEKTGFLHDFEYTLKRRDGTSISVVINAAVRTDKSGNVLGYQGIIHDITERKRLEEERQKTARLESIGTLAGGIAHDFNNILGAIIGNISLAKTEIPPGQGAHDLMKDAEKAVMRAKELTRQLLTFSRGGAPVKKRTQLRNTIIDTANFATRGTNVRCRFNVSDDLRPADVDEGQISQVIQNLVINARQAMPTGGDIDIASENIILTEEMRLGRSLPLSPGMYIRVTVKDNGIGIKPEHLDKIFDPYFTTKQSGSGLGLATCYSIIRNHGGLISVESSPGSGSTFYVYLPASEDPAENAGKDERKAAIHMNGRILVMDDEATLRTIISNMLKRLGFGHIEVAASGEEALGLYIQAQQAKQPFDVVILDLTVPGGMGGKETLEKLREVDPKVVAIVSSGYANEAIMSDYTRYGFKGVIVKPYTFDELKSALHDLMERHKHN